MSNCAKTTLAKNLFFLVLLVAPWPLAAQPVGSIDLMFSIDGGATFTDTATVDDMESVLLRFYFDNTGDIAGTAAAVATTLPAGFQHTPGTTRICLEPSPGEVVCSTDVGQSGAVDEASVWTAESLSISPTAGLYGQDTGVTSGLLEIGKTRYLNIHDCQYFNGLERFFTTSDPDISGTNISATIDAAAACAGSVGAYGLAGNELRTVDLLAFRYLNYHECHYNFLTDHIIKVADGTATTTSNNPAAAFNCAGTAGAHILHPDSAVTNFDFFGRRFLNLWECRYLNGGDLISVNSLFGIGSQTSDTPDAAPSCPATAGAYTLNDSDLLALDSLDSTRGGGYVEVEVLVASGGGDFDFEVTLDAAEFAPLTDSGTLTVVPVALPGPDPSVDLKFSQTCDNSFSDMAMPYPGEVFTTRVYFDNTGDLVGTDAAITTTMPDGYTLVPGSTRVCLEPGDGEIVCNTDPGQTGAIDEAAVWSGQTLTISPTAGVLGHTADATTGPLETGRMRYLNLHECHYYNGFNDRLFLTLGQGATGTNIGNSQDTDAECGPAAHGGTLLGGLISHIDLLGHRYLNLHECQYNLFFDRIFLDGSGASGTNASNVADSVIDCQPMAGAHVLLPAESHATAIDLAEQRFLNLHECVLQNGSDHVAMLAGGGNGTNADDEEDPLVVCPSSSGAHSLVTGTVSSLDLLDRMRGRGFVEYQVTAGPVVGDFLQAVSLSGNEYPDEVDDGMISAAGTLFFKDGFECGDTSQWAATLTKP